MTWSPNPTLTIGTTDYTGNALESVRITRGRTEIYDEPRAGYLVCELLAKDGQQLGITPFQRVTMTVENTAGTPITLFAGLVTDTAATLFDSGFESGTSGSITTIIAVGPLALASRRQVAVDGLDASKDGDRIAALMFEALAQTWEESAGTWAQQQGTWDTFDPGLDPDRIDTPGVFDIAALDPQEGGYDALLRAYLTGLSAQGILFDDRQGFIAYADADRRVATDTADDYLPLPASALGAQGVAVRSQGGDIVNAVAVTFDGGVVDLVDTGSVLELFRLSRAFETNLANESNAIAWAERYLVNHSGPILKLQQLQSRLDTLDDDALIDQLLELDVNDGIRLSGIPSTLGLSFRRTFLEGLEWAIDRRRVVLALNLSDAALSIGFQRWSSVNPSLAWEDVAATLTWQDATVVTA